MALNNLIIVFLFAESDAMKGQSECDDRVSRVYEIRLKISIKNTVNLLNTGDIW